MQDKKDGLAIRLQFLYNAKEEFPNKFAIFSKEEQTGMNTSYIRRTWVEIDLDKLTHNYAQACKLCGPGVKVTCVLKSNAYGHGAVEVARALAQAGAESFAVSCVREALELRHNGITGEILVMGTTEEEALTEAIQKNIQLTVSSYVQAQAIQLAAQRLPSMAAIHIKIDTGMHRLGFVPGQETVYEILQIAKLPHIHIQGLYSHLALIGKERDQLQHDRLQVINEALRTEGLFIPELHLCDSIGLVRYPNWQYNRVRTGALLFGVWPMGSETMDFSCQETLTLKTTIAQITQVAMGEPVGYDDRELLKRDSRIATLCAGYGDGYPRCMSRTASVLIHGKLAPVIGLVCMDQMMVDVTDIPLAKPGDEVCLLGGGISYMTYANWANTNRNEAITLVSRRPPRVYLKNGAVWKVVDELLKDGGVTQ